MRILISILFCLFTLFSKGQIIDSTCLFPIGPAIDNDCQMSRFQDTIFNGQISTQCFTYTPIDSCFTLDFLLVDGVACGPSAYGMLSFQIFNPGCDTLISQGTIYPTPNNTWNCPGLGNYTICYTFKAKCTLVAGCPLINPSPLPITWLTTRAVYSEEEKRIYITWSVASQYNVNHYEVLKYLPNWIEINRVNPDFISITPTYLVLDEVPVKYNIYVIKEVDNNGEFKLSKPFNVFLDDKKDIPCQFFTIFGTPIELSKLSSGGYIKKCGETYSRVIHIK